MEWPAASVILAVYNEIDHIDEVLADLFGQDYAGSLQVIVADGGSTDGTRHRLGAIDDPRLTVIDNPDRRQSPGLNRAAAVASGEILVRADGHTRFAADFVTCSVAGLLETDAVAVGGRMNPVGSTVFERAVAAAMNSRMILPARFHHATERTVADTAYLGAFRKDAFEAIGGLRSFPSNSSEDADLYARWRAHGETVIVDPAIHTTYSPRGNLRSLADQYFHYGMGKAEMLYANRRLPSLRPLAPALLVAAFATFLTLALFGLWQPLVALSAIWFVWLLTAAVRSRGNVALVLMAAAVMQLTYGVGLIWGLIRGPTALR